MAQDCAAQRRVVRLCGVMICAALVAGCEAPKPEAAAPTMALVDSPRSTSVATTSATSAQAEQIEAVRAALLALGPGVDPREAARVARISVQEPLVWAQQWQVVDPPLVHNFKVVNGFRDKGVCQDWANAMQAALQAEGLRSLQIHRAMANARNVRLEHATVIVTARGQPMEQGLILDPWRIGQGQLWFGTLAQDDRYEWESLASVRAWNAQWRARAAAAQ